MAQRFRYYLSNPLELLAYAVEHPRRVLAAVVVVLAIIVVLSFGLGLVPDWTMLFAIAVVSGYLGRRRYHRAKLFLQAKQTDSGRVSSGLVRVDGAADAADGAGAVEFDGTESVAYRNRVGEKSPKTMAEPGGVRRRITASQCRWQSTTVLARLPSTATAPRCDSTGTRKTGAGASGGISPASNRATR